MIRFSFGWLGVLARASLVATTAFVAACGSGAVSSPPTPPVIGPINISPSTATLYSDTPTTFIITGGNGEYIVTSSDQSALPVAGAFSGGNALVLVPNPVAADTPVTLTVRDTTGTTAPVTAALTVKPRTVSNVVTVLPSTTDCTTAVCSGGDAEVTVKIAQNGLPLANHTIRFEVVSGNFGIITSLPGLPETTSLNGTTTTDASGIARMRIRAATDAPSQTALLQITDLASGSTQRVSFLIAQNTGTSAGFVVTPDKMTFKGADTAHCSSGASADVYVFGGVPPYTVANSFPGFFAVSTSVIATSGGRFTLTTQGPCIENGVITVRDSAGRTSTVTVTNAVGTQAPAALVAAPKEVTLSDCNSSAFVTLAGGTGSYSATSGSGSVSATASGNIVTIRRIATSPATTSPVLVGVSDGVSTTTVTVNLTGAGAAACPSTGTAPGAGPLVATPPSITLTDCTTSVNFQVSGGTFNAPGGYTYAPNGSSFSAQQFTGTNNTSTFVVRRAAGSSPPSGVQSITVSDGNSSVTVPISFSGTAPGGGAGQC